MIFIGLGANLPGKFGGPEATLQKTFEELNGHGFKVLDISDIWLTAPVPYVPDHPWYRNAVISVSTEKTPLQTLKTLLQIEQEFGRVRSTRNAPRVIDLDLLCYDSLCCDVPGLTLPHPRMHERGFVLYPLKDICPNWSHPATGQYIDELLGLLPSDQQAFRNGEETVESPALAAQ